MEFKQIKGPITCTSKTQCCHILLMFLLRTLKKKSASLTSSLFFSCIGEQCRVATIDTTRSNGQRVAQGLGCASGLSSYTIRQRHVYFPETRHMSCALFLSLSLSLSLRKRRSLSIFRRSPLSLSSLSIPSQLLFANQTLFISSSAKVIRRDCFGPPSYSTYTEPPIAVREEYAKPPCSIIFPSTHDAPSSLEIQKCPFRRSLFERTLLNTNESPHRTNPPTETVSSTRGSIGQLKDGHRF